MRQIRIDERLPLRRGVRPEIERCVGVDSVSGHLIARDLPFSWKRPVVFTAFENGAIDEIFLDENDDATAVLVKKTIVSSLSFSAPKKEELHYAAVETDISGRYLAHYEASNPSPSRVKLIKTADMSDFDFLHTSDLDVAKHVAHMSKRVELEFERGEMISVESRGTVQSKAGDLSSKISQEASSPEHVDSLAVRLSVLPPDGCPSKRGFVRSSRMLRESAGKERTLILSPFSDVERWRTSSQLSDGNVPDISELLECVEIPDGAISHADRMNCTRTLHRAIRKHGKQLLDEVEDLLLEGAPVRTRRLLLSSLKAHPMPERATEIMCALLARKECLEDDDFRIDVLNSATIMEPSVPLLNAVYEAHLTLKKMDEGVPVHSIENRRTEPLKALAALASGLPGERPFVERILLSEFHAVVAEHDRLHRDHMFWRDRAAEYYGRNMTYGQRRLYRDSAKHWFHRAGEEAWETASPAERAEWEHHTLDYIRREMLCSVAGDCGTAHVEALQNSRKLGIPLEQRELSHLIQVDDGMLRILGALSNFRGPVFAPKVAPLVTSYNRAVRAMAVKALGKMDHPLSVRALHTALADTSPVVVISAMESLTELKAKDHRTSRRLIETVENWNMHPGAENCTIACEESCVHRTHSRCKRNCGHRCMIPEYMHRTLRRHLEEVHGASAESIDAGAVAMLHHAQPHTRRLILADDLGPRLRIQLGSYRVADFVFDPVDEFGMGVELYSRNIMQLELGIFGGYFELDLYNQAVLAVSLELGFAYVGLDLLTLKAVFNAGFEFAIRVGSNTVNNFDVGPTSPMIIPGLDEPKFPCQDGMIEPEHPNRGNDIVLLPRQDQRTLWLAETIHDSTKAAVESLAEFIPSAAELGESIAEGMTIVAESTAFAHGQLAIVSRSELVGLRALVGQNRLQDLEDNRVGMRNVTHTSVMFDNVDQITATAGELRSAFRRGISQLKSASTSSLRMVEEGEAMESVVPILKDLNDFSGTFEATKSSVESFVSDTDPLLESVWTSLTSFAEASAENTTALAKEFRAAANEVHQMYSQLHELAQAIRGMEASSLVDQLPMMGRSLLNNMVTSLESVVHDGMYRLKDVAITPILSTLAEDAARSAAELRDAASLSLAAVAANFHAKRASIEDSLQTLLETEAVDLLPRMEALAVSMLDQSGDQASWSESVFSILSSSIAGCVESTAEANLQQTNTGFTTAFESEQLPALTRTGLAMAANKSAASALEPSINSIPQSMEDSAEVILTLLTNLFDDALPSRVMATFSGAFASRAAELATIKNTTLLLRQQLVEDAEDDIDALKVSVKEDLKSSNLAALLESIKESLAPDIALTIDTSGWKVPTLTTWEAAVVNEMIRTGLDSIALTQISSSAEACSLWNTTILSLPDKLAVLAADGGADSEVLDRLSGKLELVSDFACGTDDVVSMNAFVSIADAALEVLLLDSIPEVEDLAKALVEILFSQVSSREWGLFAANSTALSDAQKRTALSAVYNSFQTLKLYSNAVLRAGQSIACELPGDIDYLADGSPFSGRARYLMDRLLWAGCSHGTFLAQFQTLDEKIARVLSGYSLRHLALVDGALNRAPVSRLLPPLQSLAVYDYLSPDACFVGLKSALLGGNSSLELLTDLQAGVLDIAALNAASVDLPAAAALQRCKEAVVLNTTRPTILKMRQFLSARAEFVDASYSADVTETVLLYPNSCDGCSGSSHLAALQSFQTFASGDLDWAMAAKLSFSREDVSLIDRALMISRSSPIGTPSVSWMTRLLNVLTEVVVRASVRGELWSTARDEASRLLVQTAVAVSSDSILNSGEGSVMAESYFLATCLIDGAHCDAAPTIEDLWDVLDDTVPDGWKNPLSDLFAVRSFSEARDILDHLDRILLFPSIEPWLHNDELETVHSTWTTSALLLLEPWGNASRLLSQCSGLHSVAFGGQAYEFSEILFSMRPAHLDAMDHNASAPTALKAAIHTRRLLLQLMGLENLIDLANDWIAAGYSAKTAFLETSSAMTSVESLPVFAESVESAFSEASLPLSAALRESVMEAVQVECSQLATDGYPLSALCLPDADPMSSAFVEAAKTENPLSNLLSVMAHLDVQTALEAEISHLVNSAVLWKSPELIVPLDVEWIAAGWDSTTHTSVEQASEASLDWFANHATPMVPADLLPMLSGCEGAELVVSVIEEDWPAGFPIQSCDRNSLVRLLEASLLAGLQLSMGPNSLRHSSFISELYDLQYLLAQRLAEIQVQTAFVSLGMHGTLVGINGAAATASSLSNAALQNAIASGYADVATRVGRFFPLNGGLSNQLNVSLAAILSNNSYSSKVLEAAFAAQRSLGAGDAIAIARSLALLSSLGVDMPLETVGLMSDTARGLLTLAEFDECVVASDAALAVHSSLGELSAAKIAELLGPLRSGVAGIRFWYDAEFWPILAGIVSDFLRLYGVTFVEEALVKGTTCNVIHANSGLKTGVVEIMRSLVDFARNESFVLTDILAIPVDPTNVEESVMLSRCSRSLPIALRMLKRNSTSSAGMLLLFESLRDCGIPSRWSLLNSVLNSRDLVDMETISLVSLMNQFASRLETSSGLLTLLSELQDCSSEDTCAIQDLQSVTARFAGEIVLLSARSSRITSLSAEFESPRDDAIKGAIQKVVLDCRATYCDTSDSLTSLFYGTPVVQDPVVHHELLLIRALHLFGEAALLARRLEFSVELLNSPALTPSEVYLPPGHEFDALQKRYVDVSAADALLYDPQTLVDAAVASAGALLEEIEALMAQNPPIELSDGTVFGSGPTRRQLHHLTTLHSILKTRIGSIDGSSLQLSIVNLCYIWRATEMVPSDVASLVVSTLETLTTDLSALPLPLADMTHLLCSSDFSRAFSSEWLRDRVIADVEKGMATLLHGSLHELSAVIDGLEVHFSTPVLDFLFGAEAPVFRQMRETLLQMLRDAEETAVWATALSAQLNATATVFDSQYRNISSWTYAAMEESVTALLEALEAAEAQVENADLLVQIARTIGIAKDAQDWTSEAVMHLRFGYAIDIKALFTFAIDLNQKLERLRTMDPDEMLEAAVDELKPAIDAYGATAVAQCSEEFLPLYAVDFASIADLMAEDLLLIAHRGDLSFNIHEAALQARELCLTMQEAAESIYSGGYSGEEVEEWNVLRSSAIDLYSFYEGQFGQEISPFQTASLLTKFAEMLSRVQRDMHSLLSADVFVSCSASIERLASFASLRSALLRGTAEEYLPEDLMDEIQATVTEEVASEALSLGPRIRSFVLNVLPTLPITDPTANSLLQTGSELDSTVTILLSDAVSGRVDALINETASLNSFTAQVGLRRENDSAVIADAQLVAGTAISHAESIGEMFAAAQGETEIVRSLLVDLAPLISAARTDVAPPLKAYLEILDGLPSLLGNFSVDILPHIDVIREGLVDVMEECSGYSSFESAKRTYASLVARVAILNDLLADILKLKHNLVDFGTAMQDRAGFAAQLDAMKVSVVDVTEGLLQISRSVEEVFHSMSVISSINSTHVQLKEIYESLSLALEGSLFDPSGMAKTIKYAIQYVEQVRAKANENVRGYSTELELSLLFDVLPASKLARHLEIADVLSSFTALSGKLITSLGFVNGLLAELPQLQIRTDSMASAAAVQLPKMSLAIQLFAEHVKENILGRCTTALEFKGEYPELVRSLNLFEGGLEALLDLQEAQECVEGIMCARDVLFKEFLEMERVLGSIEGGLEDFAVFFESLPTLSSSLQLLEIGTEHADAFSSEVAAFTLQVGSGDTPRYLASASTAHDDVKGTLMNINEVAFLVKKRLRRTQGALDVAEAGTARMLTVTGDADKMLDAAVLVDTRLVRVLAYQDGFNNITGIVFREFPALLDLKGDLTTLVIQSDIVETESAEELSVAVDRSIAAGVVLESSNEMFSKLNSELRRLLNPEEPEEAPEEAPALPSWCDTEICLSMQETRSNHSSITGPLRYLMLYYQSMPALGNSWDDGRLLLPGLKESWTPRGVHWYGRDKYLLSLQGDGVTPALIVGMTVSKARDRKIQRVLKLMVHSENSTAEAEEHVPFLGDAADLTVVGSSFVYVADGSKSNGEPNNVIHRFSWAKIKSLIEQGGPPAKVFSDREFKVDAYPSALFYDEQDHILWVSDFIPGNRYQGGMSYTVGTQTNPYSKNNVGAIRSGYNSDAGGRMNVDFNGVQKKDTNFMDDKNSGASSINPASQVSHHHLNGWSSGYKVSTVDDVFESEGTYDPTDPASGLGSGIAQDFFNEQYEREERVKEENPDLFGSLSGSGLGDGLGRRMQPQKCIIHGPNVQGFALFRRLNRTFVTLTRCNVLPGYSCGVEFHKLGEMVELEGVNVPEAYLLNPGFQLSKEQVKSQTSDYRTVKTNRRGDSISQKGPRLRSATGTLVQKMRVPSGAESLSYFLSGDDQFMALTFSTGSASMLDVVQTSGLIAEDRVFRFSIPPLANAKPNIHENLVSLSAFGFDLLGPYCLLPLSAACKRKRDALKKEEEEEAGANAKAEKDLEEMLKDHKFSRMLAERQSSVHSRRLEGTDDEQTVDILNCLSGTISVLYSDITIAQAEVTIIVLGVPVTVSTTAGFFIKADLSVSICFKDQVSGLGLGPSANVYFSSGAYLTMAVIRIGATLDIVIFDTVLQPAARLGFADGGAERSCFSLALTIYPLDMVFYFEVSTYTCVKSLIPPKIGWCAAYKKVIWSYYMKKLAKTLSSGCSKPPDDSPPVGGTIDARQLDGRAVIVEIDGFFDEESGVESYEVCLGNQGPLSQSLGCYSLTSSSAVLENVNLTDKAEVFVTGIAMNTEGLETAVSSSFFAKSAGPLVTDFQFQHAMTGEWQNSTDFWFGADSVQVRFKIDPDSGPATMLLRFCLGTSPGKEDLFLVSEAANAVRLARADPDEFFYVSASGVDVERLLREDIRTAYFVIEAASELNLWTIHSEPMKVDVVEPIPASRIVLNTQNNYTTRLDSIGMIWSEIGPSGLFLPDCRWSVVNYLTGKFLVPWGNLVSTQFVAASVELYNGLQYRVQLYLCNNAGVCRNSTSDVITVDSTRPSSMPLITPDVAVSPPIDHAIYRLIQLRKLGIIPPPLMSIKAWMANDQVYMRTPGEFVAHWAVWDIESGIKSLRISCGTMPGIPNLLGWIDLSPETMFFNFAEEGLEIVPNSWYYANVIARNGAGYKTVMYQGVLLDIESPTCLQSFLRHGSSIVVEELYSSDSLTMTVSWWAACMDQGGIGHYQVSAGTDEDPTSLLPWTRFDRERYNATITGLEMQDGETYFFCLKAADTAGNTSPEMCSDGIVIDTSPPTPAVVKDGNSIQHYSSLTLGDIEWTQWDQSAFISWVPASDDQSGILYYEVTAVNEEDLILGPLLTVPAYCREAVIPLWRAVPHGESVRGFVRAFNGALVSATATSDGVRIDRSLPVLLLEKFWHDDPQIENFIISDSQAVHMQYSCSDPEVEQYGFTISYAFGSYRGGADLVPWTDVEGKAASGIVSTPDDTLYFDGYSVFGMIRCRSEVGGFTVKTTSSSFFVDKLAPQTGIVVDGGSGQDQAWQSLADHLFVSMSFFKDRHTGMHSYLVGFSTDPSGSPLDIREFEDVGLAPVAFANGLDLAHNTVYYGVVKAVDRAGHTSDPIVTNGVRVDLTPPTAGLVEIVDEDGNVKLFTASRTEVALRWSGFSDEESGLLKYWIGLGSQPDRVDIVSWKPAFLSTSGAFSGLKLLHRHKYYAFIKAVNGVGLSTITASGALMADQSSALCSVWDGSASSAEGDIEFTASSKFVAGFVCEDLESGLERIQIGIGRVKGAADVLAWTDVEEDLVAASGGHIGSDGFYPQLGVRLFQCLRVWNKAGLATVVCTNGIIFDSTPPQELWPVRDGTSPVQQLYSAVPASFAVQFALFDPEVGMRSLNVTLMNLDAAEPAPVTEEDGSIAVRALDVDARSAVLVHALAHGSKYAVLLQATNNIGLTSAILSPGMTIDLTPPVCTQPTDGFELGVDWEYSPIRGGLAASISCADDESGLNSAIVRIVQLLPEEIVLSAWTRAPLSKNGIAFASGVDLQLGSKYAMELQTENGAGITSEVLRTNGVVVDWTKPEAEFVHDTVLRDGEDIMFQREFDRVGCQWSFSDPESPIEVFDVLYGTSVGASDIGTFQLDGSTSDHLVTGLDLPYGIWVFVTVTATNAAGLKTTMVSDGVIIDPTPPVFSDTASPVPFALHVEYPYRFNDQPSYPSSISGITVRMRGLGHFIEPESLFLRYETRLFVEFEGETSLLKTDIRFTPTVVAFEGLEIHLQSSLHVNVTAFAWDGDAQKLTEVVLVDPPALIPGIVLDGPFGEDAEYQPETDAVWARWSGFQTFPALLPLEYEVCFGTTPGGDDVVGWHAANEESVGHVITVLSALPSNASVLGNLTDAIADGTVVFATVKATSPQGAVVTVSSDGVLLDESTPEIDIRIGLNGQEAVVEQPVIVSWNVTSISPTYECVLSLGSTPFMENFAKEIVSAEAIVTETSRWES